MRTIILCILLCGFAYGNKSEKFFWDEVKNSADVELLKSYKEQYPHGVFEKLADIKIRRLQKSLDSNEMSDPNKIPSWIKGTNQYTYYAVGKANKHFKGEYYQENLARSRAEKKLQKKYDNNNLSNKRMIKYNGLVEQKKYIDKKGRVYILIYLDNYNL